MPISPQKEPRAFLSPLDATPASPPPSKVPDCSEESTFIQRQKCNRSVLLFNFGANTSIHGVPFWLTHENSYMWR